MRFRQLLPLFGALFALYIIWGSTYFVIRIGVESWPPLMMAGVRFLAAGILLLAFLLLRGHKLPPPRPLLNAALIGLLLLAVGNGMVTVAEHQNVPSGIAAVVVATVPLFTLCFSRLFGIKTRKLEWVAKGSLINKVILVPLALIISAFIPWAITPLLMIGGAFLCFEGVEKVLHMLEARKHKEDPAQSQQRLEKLAAQDPLKFEKDKIKGAIRTDFILSAEIVAITLGIVAEAPLLNQVLVLSGIALVVTVGVYGLVGVIVKIDDLGYWLAEKSSALMQALGKGLLIIAPWLMKALSIVGTLAMFLVGGGIVVHGIAPLHHAIEHFAGQQSAVVAMILPTVLNLILGFIIGGIVVLGVKAVAKMRGQAH
jgi:uncharacterized protein